MLTALILAACLTPPLFDMTGPACTPARQVVECGCSECFTWPPVLTNYNTGTPAAAWYEISRDNPDGTTTLVGDTIGRNRAWYVDEGIFFPPVVSRLWCFAWDDPFPAEGLTYAYRVRACNAAGCSPWSTPFVRYTAAPYACYVWGLEVPCYPGDPLLRP